LAACLAGACGLSWPGGARAGFNLSITDFTGPGGSYSVSELFGGGFSSSVGGAGNSGSYTASDTQIHVLATVDGYKFDVTAYSNEDTGLPGSFSPAVVTVHAHVTAPGIEGASNFGIVAGDDNFLFPGDPSSSVHLSADVNTGLVTGGNSIKSKAFYDNGTAYQTLYAGPLTSSFANATSGSVTVAPRGASFNLSNVDVAFDSNGLGSMEFQADAVVGMPEPSAIVMALLGAPFALVGLRRGLKRARKTAAAA
jgi:hypothetical protein